MSTALQTRPIKTELLKLKKRLALSLKVKDVLSERLVILTNELFIRIQEAKALRKKLYERILQNYTKYLSLKSLYGYGLNSIAEAGIYKPKLEIFGENIIGVKSKGVKITLEKIENLKYIALDDLKDEMVSILDILSDLATIEYSIHQITTEIMKTKRKVSALQYIAIPRLRRQIKIISMRFDEKEREEKARLKRVKELLETRKK